MIVVVGIVVMFSRKPPQGGKNPAQSTIHPTTLSTKAIADNAQSGFNIVMITRS